MLNDFDNNADKGNVISLIDKKKEQADKQENLSEDRDVKVYFDNVLKRNEEIRERLRREREKANRSVLKSYRIKP